MIAAREAGIPANYRRSFPPLIDPKLPNGCNYLCALAL